MFRRKGFAIAVLCISASLMIGCSHPGSGAGDTSSAARHDDDKGLNLFIWSDFLAPDTLVSFEKLTGVKVHVSYFDTNETLANAIPTSSPLLDALIVADPAIYPPPDQQQRLFVQLEDPPEQSRAITRIWQKFKTGQ